MARSRNAYRDRNPALIHGCLQKPETGVARHSCDSSRHSRFVTGQRKFREYHETSAILNGDVDEALVAGKVALNQSSGWSGLSDGDSHVEASSFGHGTAVQAEPRRSAALIEQE